MSVQGKHASFGLFLILAFANLLEVSPLKAQENGSPFCATEDPYFPNGKIAHIENRYFRICDGPILFPQDEFNNNSYFVRLDSRYQIEKLLFDFPERIRRVTMQLATSYSANSYINRFGEVLQPSHSEVFDRRSYYNVGRVSFGAVEYDIVVHGGLVTRSQDALSAGGLPPHADYLFDGPAELNLPEHYLGCRGDPLVVPQVDYNCRIVIRYRPSERISIQSSFLWSPSFLTWEGIKPPFDLADLPLRIQALMHIAQQIDVTDDIEELRGFV